MDYFISHQLYAALYESNITSQDTPIDLLDDDNEIMDKCVQHFKNQDVDPYNVVIFLHNCFIQNQKPFDAQKLQQMAKRCLDRIV